MLSEIKNIRQIQGEPFRRWFSDDIFDLIVWSGPDRRITGFQLCYITGEEEKALVWTEKNGFSHKDVDEGESLPFHAKMTPVLLPDGVLKKDEILPLFDKASREMDQAVAEFVSWKIREYPECITG